MAMLDYRKQALFVVLLYIETVLVQSHMDSVNRYPLNLNTVHIYGIQKNIKIIPYNFGYGVWVHLFCHFYKGNLLSQLPVCFPERQRVSKRSTLKGKYLLLGKQVSFFGYKTEFLPSKTMPKI